SRGVVRLGRKEHTEALGEFHRVLTADHSLRPAYLGRVQVCFLRGDDNRGLADLTTFPALGRAKPFDPKDALLFARRGRLLVRLVPRWGLSLEDYVAKLRSEERRVGKECRSRWVSCV